MTSLADAYGEVGEVVSRERLYLGLALFGAGAALTALGVIVATTDVLAAFGLSRTAAWRRAGVLAGLGVPAVIGGVFTVLPSGKRIKAAATIGAGVSVFGVALFWYAYPTHWAGYGQNLTLPVTGIYFFGTATSVWCMFVGIANFKRRNDPGGTVSLKVTKGGETKVVEVDRAELRSKGLGGIGVFGGSGGDSSVSAGTGTSVTQSAITGTSSSSSSSSSASGPATRTGSGGATTQASARPAGATSDGGREDNEIRSVSAGDQVLSSSDHARDTVDRYCGNCEHFRYVRTEEGMQPYCGFDGDVMDDMESCDEWEPNT